MFTFQVLFLCLSLISAQHIANHPCPERPIQQNFDLEKYISQNWYGIIRYDAAFERNCSCSRAIYTLNNDDGSVKVKNCCRKPEGNECAIGKAILSEPNHAPVEGKLNVAFGNQPLTKSNYWILSTDYDNYSVVYYCANLSPNKSLQFSWVLSTKPQLDESVTDHVNEIIDKYFERSAMIIVNQSESFCEPRD